MTTVSLSVQPGYAMTLSPASVRVLATAQHGYAYHGSVKVTDTGRNPIRVTVTTQRMPATGQHCATGSGPVPWITLDARTVILHSGESRVMGYTVHGSPAQGGQSAAVVATESPLTVARGPSVHGALGSRVTLATGTTATCHAPAALPAPPASGGIPLAGLAIVAALVLAVLAVLVIARRRVVAHRT